MAKPLAVLAYSGGLDTTVILHWLRDQRLGRRDLHREPRPAGRRPRGRGRQGAALGAVDAYVEDLRAELVDEFFLPVLQMHARYEGRYLLGTSIARIPTARGQMRYAKRIGGNVLVHGSTGKGNDQVRFETDLPRAAGRPGVHAGATSASTRPGRKPTSSRASAMAAVA